MPFEIRFATVADTGWVSEILTEAAAWLDDTGRHMWRNDELDARRIADDVAAGFFVIAWSGTEATGVVKFQLEDLQFWPDKPAGEAAYIHRLAVRRRFAGGGVSTALMTWAVEETRRRGRRALRLDCEADRVHLRSIYERFGFRHHSDREVPPYVVSRYEYLVE
jgi:GNAT superfamily N-acetyltransferase